MERRAEWYFDFISPYSYLQFATFDRLPEGLEVRLRPVLFAGLLKHWEHKGPAEIPAKRRHAYRYCQWRAERLGVPFRMPPRHPFNPLAALRLALALDAERAVVATIFRHIWAEGRDLEVPESLAALAAELGVDDAAARIADPAVKARLRATTEDAIARGVFGVPTFVVDGELFWGEDMGELMRDYLADPERFRSGEFARLAELSLGTERPRG